MYLITMVIVLDLDPEVTFQDRERLLRSMRDKLLKQQGKLAIRSDNDASLMLAFFDENFARAKSRAEEILERVETLGEARISTNFVEIFQWYEGRFRKTQDSLDSRDEDDSSEESEFHNSAQAHLFSRLKKLRKKQQKDVTIVYDHDKDEREFNSKLAKKI